MSKRVLDFNKKVVDSDLLPSWRTLHFTMPDAITWGHFSKFAAYCSSLGYEVEQSGEALVPGFLAALAESGRTYGDLRVGDMRRDNVKLRASQPNIVLPPLAAPSVRATPRIDQFEALDPVLQDEIDTLATMTVEGKVKSQNSVTTARNFILRFIELAETRSVTIHRLKDLFQDTALEAIEAANYGAPAGIRWQDSENAKKSRSRLLETGRVYAFDVVFDDELGEALDAYLRNTPPAEKPSGGIARKARENSRILVHGDTAQKLIAAARKTAATFFANPRKKGAFEQAQIGIAVLLLLGTGRPPFKIRSAAFIGPSCDVQTRNGVVRRPTLLLAKDATLKDFEGEASAGTRKAIDNFWLGACALLGRPPGDLLAKRNGEVKSGSAFCVGVKKLCATVGVDMPPETIQVGVVRGLVEYGYGKEEIADSLGVSQLINFETRFGALFDAKASQEHADDVMKEKPDFK